MQRSLLPQVVLDSRLLGTRLYRGQRVKCSSAKFIGNLSQTAKGARARLGYLISMSVWGVVFRLKIFGRGLDYWKTTRRGFFIDFVLRVRPSLEKIFIKLVKIRFTIRVLILAFSNICNIWMLYGS